MLERISKERYADLGYGLLITVGVGAIVISVNTWLPGFTFGVGVMFGYMLHVLWRMAQFDPYETVEEELDDVGEKVDHMEETMEDIRDKFDDIDRSVSDE